MEENKIYDVCIIGAGPAGSTCAYYLAQKGFQPLILEKKEFPRDKICGDAFTQRCFVHLERMGVLQKLIEEKKGHWTAIGGLVSPSGITYIGDSASETGSHLVMSVKRKIMDEMLVRAAVNAGSKLVENFSVNEVIFDKNKGIWIIKSKQEESLEYNAKILVLGDGSSSRLAQSLGIIKDPPQAVCSRAYIKAETYNFEYDGLTIFPPKLVPGYCAFMKEADNDVVFCCYIIPFGKAKTDNLHGLHHEFIEKDPFVSKAIGPHAELEQMKAAPIRFGGIKQSYDDHLLVVGDAAGMIDPLTGEGLQYAMDAAEIAANTIHEGFQKKDFSKSFFKHYHKQWLKSFGNDFKWSIRMARFCGKHPIFLDAFASVSLRKGDKFMVEWGKIMTGSKKKINFFMPKLAFPLAFEVLRLKRKFKRKDLENS